jgi:hypothetical protein
MSFTLLDMSSENYEFAASVWNWKAALELIKGFDVLSEGTLRQLGYNATGAKLSMEEAHIIGRRLRDEVLPKLRPGERIFADGTITNEPDDMTLFRDDDEQWKNYSVSREWLAELAEFCLRSKGFQVF